MENGKVIQIEETKPEQKGLVLTPEGNKRLTDFFSILIQIDRRVTKEKTYGKQNK